MKLATTTGDFRKYTTNQLDSLSLIREAGFKYADYNFHLDYIRGDGVYSNNCESYFASVAQRAENVGITLVQAHSPMGDPIDEDNDRFVDDTLRCVDACGAWGIQNLVVHSGYAEGLTKNETLKQNKDFFLKILERAEKYGINILVENFNKMCYDHTFWIDNATDLLALIKLVDHPLFHAVWDMGHANLQDMPQHEELAILGREVKALHVQDNGGEWDQHLMPFTGTLNMDSVMHGLMDIGYSGYFTFEVADPFTVGDAKRRFPSDTRLLETPLSLKNAWERSLYELGKSVLSAYGVFEE